MKKYLILTSLCLMACNDPQPPQGWAEATASRWAQAAKLNQQGIVCTDPYQHTHDQAACSINTGTQVINLWCYYRATPYCLPQLR